MNRRDFLITLPVTIATVGAALRKKRRVIVQVIRQQLPNGQWIKAWSEARKPDGTEWTGQEIKQNSFEAITVEVVAPGTIR